MDVIIVERRDIIIKQFMNGFAKIDHNVTLGQSHFIGQLLAILIHYLCTVVLMGLVDWSAFLELVLLTM